MRLNSFKVPSLHNFFVLIAKKLASFPHMRLIRIQFFLDIFGEYIR